MKNPRVSRRKEILKIRAEINAKETNDLYTENYKTLMKEIKDDANRQRILPYSWTW